MIRLLLLLLVAAEVLGLLARGLRIVPPRRDRLVAVFLAWVACLPWWGGSRVFLPVDDPIARNVPGATLPADPDVHGAYNDVVLQLYPWEQAVRASLAAGRLPFWSDALDGGAPLWSNPQAGALSPFAWPARLMPIEQFFLAQFALKLVVGALGAWVLAAALGLRRPTRRVTAIAFALGGGIAAWALFPLGGVVACAPWVVATAIVAVRRRRKPWIAGSLLVALTLLVGHPEAALGAAGASGFCAAAFLRRRATVPEKARALGAVVAVWILGAALAAPALVPQALRVARSLRAESAAGRADPGAAGAAWFEGDAAHLARSFVHWRALGRPFVDERPRALPWPVAGSCYCGGAIAFGWLCAWGERRRRRTLAWLTVGAVSFFLLAAGFLPLAGLLRALPFGDAIAVSRWLPTAALFWIAAGALGFEALARGRTRRAPALAALALVALATLAIARPPAGSVAAFALLAVAIAFPVRRPAGRRPAVRWPAAFLAAAVAVDLVPFAFAYLPAGHPELVYPATPCLQALRAAVAMRPGTRVTAGGRLVYPSLLPAYGMAEIRVDDPSADRDLIAFLDAAFGFRPESARYKGTMQRLPPGALSFLGVSTLLLPANAPPPVGWAADDESCRPLRVATNDATVPRWFVPTRVVGAPARRFDWVEQWSEPREVRWDEAAGPPPAMVAAPPRLLASGSDGRVVLELEPPPSVPQVIASSTPFSAGWRATAGGADLETTRINGAYLGFVAPAGARRIEVRFTPPGLAAGCLAAAAAVLALAALGVRRTGSSAL